MHLQFDDPDVIRDAYAGRAWPDDQVRLFSGIERMFPTRRVRHGNAVRQLVPADTLPGEFSFRSQGDCFDLYDYVTRNRVAGLLILAGDRIAIEQYQLGITAKTRWMSMSMAKSVSSTLLGAALQDGHIDSLDDPLDRYVPALGDGSYRGVTVRQLLRMTSGVAWDESHTNPASERRRMLELQIGQKPGSILDFMCALPGSAAPGTRWNYSTGETHILGELLRAATGRWLADYLAEKIWMPAGMAADAEWWLESPGGLEVAGSGLCATLRDWGRFGLFVLEGGLADGRELLPPDWFREAGAPFTIDGDVIDYGYMWWPVGSPDRDGAFSARGIFGQRIYVNPRRQVVIVTLCARSKPMNSETIVDNDFFDAVARHLAP